MKKINVLLAAVLTALGLCSCGTTNSDLDRFKGHWVDLNSECTLDISENKMTVTLSGGQEEVYTVKAEQEDDVYWLTNADGSGCFGMMSELSEYKEEHLSASDQVLDAEGHQYEFVREEVKEEETKIKDKSTDMPKTIESDVIESFSLRFTNCGQYGLDDEWPQCRYSWEVDREEDGTYTCNYSESYDECMGRSYYGEVSEDFVKNLADTIKKADIAAHNGYNMGNNVSGTDYSLRVIYDSGEELKIKATGDAGDSCVFDLGALMEAVKPLLEED